MFRYALRATLHKSPSTQALGISVKLENGINELARIETRFLADEITIQHVRTLVFGAFLNHVPPGVNHTSDINEIDRIANSMSESIERIEFCELPKNYKTAVSLLLETAKEKLNEIYAIYPKRAKNWPNETAT